MLTYNSASEQSEWSWLSGGVNWDIRFY